MVLFSIQMVVKCLFVGFFQNLFLHFVTLKKRLVLWMLALFCGVMVYANRTYAMMWFLLYTGFIYFYMNKGKKESMFITLLTLSFVGYSQVFVDSLKLYDSFICILLCIIYLFVQHLLPKIKNCSLCRIEWFIYGVWLAISDFIYAYLHCKTIKKSTSGSYYMLYVWFFLFGMLFMNGFLLYLLKQLDEKERQIQCLEKQLLTEEEHQRFYADLKQANSINQSFRHDQATMFGVLQMLLKQDSHRALQYLNACMKDIKNTDVVLSGNIVLDQILSSRAQKMNQEQSVMQLYICSSLDDLDDYDLSIIIGNLLDNAIEASTYVEQKRIIVNIWEDEYLYYIKIKNHYNKDKICVVDGHFQSCKEDLQNHGIGLNNVLKHVEKLDGMFLTKLDEQNFIAYVSIPRAI